MIAYSLLPTRFEDGRHEAIEDGLRASGYEVQRAMPDHIDAADVLVTWNSYGRNGEVSQRFKKFGARHIVCEEAYFRRVNGEPCFALALWGHNGSGAWQPGGPERWAGFAVPLDPWREGGGHILVCGQRGFGYNAMAMPNSWPDDVYARLRLETARPLWFRPHPKRRRQMPSVGYDRVLDFEQPLDTHLANAWAVVVWSSNVATAALRQGIPAFYEAPHIVTQGAAQKGISGLESPNRSEVARRRAFESLAWAQWSMAEIRAGEAARHLLDEDRTAVLVA